MTQTQNAESDNRLPPPVRPRTAARLGAVQALFQMGQNGDAAESVIVQFERHRFGVTLAGASWEEGQIPEADTRLFASIVRAAALHRAAIDAKLEGALPASWPMNRLDPVLRAIITAALAESEASDPPPINVLINEYLDIAHGFFSGDEPGMINGVLDAILLRRNGTEKEAAPAENTSETGDNASS